MTDEEHRPMRGPQPHKAAGSPLRTPIPPVTPRLILLAILGVLLFLCGIIYGVWLIVRFRRYHADGGTPGV